MDEALTAQRIRLKLGKFRVGLHIKLGRSFGDKNLAGCIGKTLR